MMLGKKEIVDLYRKRSRNYDITANAYYLFGFRERAYRKRSVEALRLQAGDTVVELCCGTGLNFSLLWDAVGPSGKIIGVDLTDAMLAGARRRVERRGWSNVELIEGDAASYSFPQDVNGILSTFAITLIPEYDEIIERGAKALAPGGRFAILDLKKPERWPEWMIRVGLWTTKPFGVSLDLVARRPWESIDRHLAHSSLTEFYGGLAYLSVGEAPGHADM